MNPLESSIWMVYDTVLAVSLQSKEIGCDCDEALDGASSVGAAGTAGGAGGVELPALTSSFTTKPSPQKMDRSPFHTVSNAPVVAGKSCEYVSPVT